MCPCLGAAAVPGAEEAHAHLPVLVQVRVQPVRAVRDVVKGRRHTRIVRACKAFTKLGTRMQITVHTLTKLILLFKYKVRKVPGPGRVPVPNLQEYTSGSYW